MEDQIFAGPAHYEAETIGDADGFTSVGPSDEEPGIELSCFAYDQEEAPMSVTVTLTVEQARAYAQAVLLACDSLEKELDDL